MLITFEGIDGCGKTTQLHKLADWLQQNGYSVVSTKQPGGTRIGHKLREVLLDPKNTELVPESELFLYMADRVQHIQELILPSLKEGKIVLCDRYHDATLAYQGGGRKRDLSWLSPLQERLIPEPSLTLWFDLSIEEGQKRLHHRSLQNVSASQGAPLSEQDPNAKDRLDLESLAFHRRVQKRYQELWEQSPRRIQKVDASGSIEEIQQYLQEQLQEKLKQEQFQKN